jgi:hypothetical protein
LRMITSTRESLYRRTKSCGQTNRLGQRHKSKRGPDDDRASHLATKPLYPPSVCIDYCLMGDK